MNRRTMFMAAAAAMASVPAGWAGADEPTKAEAAVRDVISRWYHALRGRDGGAISGLLGPMAVLDADLWRCSDPFSRACGLVFDPDLLAAKSLRFTHEVRDIEVEGKLARVSVLVRAWFPSQTGDYQRAANDQFYLRRWPDKGWLIAVAAEKTTAVPD